MVNLTGLEILIDLICNLNDNSLFKQDGTRNEIIVEFEMNKPASEEKILKVEKEMQFKFPYSYREFLLNFDGGRIYDYKV
ncbi:SMI1/KNR4 family protein [Clostridium sp.]|uniref:SMI1/KNR4 family protein n=1 Tax=Clostridium sp. TaxID=1506 RepID=UPI002FC8A408